MPRIPMSDKGGLVQHQRDSVPMSGAPGMSFKLDEGQAWKELGAQIGRAGESFGGAMMNYAKAAQDTDNKLAASQARNLFNGIQGELGNRMAENPQDFGKFREWAQEADKRYADEVKQYTDKMSQGYRKEFEVEMDGLRTRALQDRVRKGIQAKVTADYELLQAQWKDAALRGDEAESRRLLDEHRGVLISEQEYQQKLLDYERMRDCGAAKRLLESGERGLAERLRARNKDGSYAEFPKMDDGYREKLIRAAKSQDEERTRQLDENLLKRFTDGNLDYGDVKEAYDRGEVPVKLFASWQRKFRELKSAEIINEADRNLNALKSRSLDDGELKMVFEGLRMEVQESVRTGELSKEQGAELEKGLAERDFRRIRNKQEWGKQSKQDAENRFLVDLRVASDYPDDPVERKAWCREALNRAMKVSDDDSFLGKVQSRCNEILKEDVSYRQTPGYRLGMHVLEGYKNAFTSYAEPARRRWYTLGIKTAGKASPEITKTNYDVVKDKFAQWLKNNPNADEGMMRQWLDDQKKFINEQCVADLLSAYAEIPTGRFGKIGEIADKQDRSQEVKIGTIVGRYRFKGGDAGKAKNWERVEK